MPERFDIRTFTPLHWILTAVAVVCGIVAFFVIAQGAGFRWDPLNSAERRADRAEASAAASRADAGARRAEAAGARDTTRLVEAAAADRAAAAAIANRYSTLAEADPDANELLDPAAAGRLHDADRELCRLRPAVCNARTAAP